MLRWPAAGRLLVRHGQVPVRLARQGKAGSGVMCWANSSAASAGLSSSTRSSTSAQQSGCKRPPFEAAVAAARICFGLRVIDWPVTWALHSPAADPATLLGGIPNLPRVGGTPFALAVHTPVVEGISQ